MIKYWLLGVYMGGLNLYLDEMSKKSRASFRMMITYTIISQVLIFIRTKILMVGSDQFFNAEDYVTAFVAITYVTEILGSGLLLAMVPLLFKEGSERGRESQLVFINNIIHITFLFSLLVIVFGYMFAPEIIAMNDGGMSQEEFASSVRLFKIGLPMVSIILLKPVHISYLQINHGFKSGPKGGVYYNLVFIAYLLFFNRFGNEGLMVAAILAYASYYIVIISSLRGFDFERRRVLDLKDPGFRELLKSLFLILIYLIIKRTVFEIDTNLIAQSGSIFGYLGNAAYIIDFISLILISVIATITYPMLAETYYKKQEEDHIKILNRSLEVLINILVPVTIALLVFAEPTIKLFFSQDSGLVFKEKILSPHEMVGTVRSLRFLGLSILFLGLDLVLVRALFSRGDFVSPIIITSSGLGINFVFGQLFYENMGEEGVGLTIAISAIAIGILLIYKLNQDQVLIDKDRFIGNIAIASILGLLAAVFVHLIYVFLGETDVGIMLGYVVGIYIYRYLYRNLDKRDPIIG